MGHHPRTNFIYAHLNRVIKKYDLDMVYVSGPDTAARRCEYTYLEGTTARSIQHLQDEEGLRKLFIPILVSGWDSQQRVAGTPGSIHEGGNSVIRSAIHSERHSTIQSRVPV